MAIRVPTVTAGVPPSVLPARPRAARAERFVFPSGLRWAATAYVVATIPLCAYQAADVRGQRGYITTLTLVTCVYAVPGLIVAAMAGRGVALRERRTWRLWTAGFALVAWDAFVIQLAVDHDLRPVKLSVAPAVALSIVVIGVANAVVIRARSGQRAAVVDALDGLAATVAVVAPVGLFATQPILSSPHAWLAAATALVAIGACHGVVSVATVTARVPRGHRTTAVLGLALMVAVVADSSAGTLQAVRDFDLPTGPLAGLHALTLGLSGLFFAWSQRAPAPGLDRFPPQAQARRRSTITVVVLVAVPVVAVEAWLWRDDRGRLLAAVAIALALLGLSGLRHLLASRETIRLYGAVEAAADERGRLLADVMGHVDADRQRVAAHLHRQAVALYSAMTTFTAALDRAQALGPHPTGTPTNHGHGPPAAAAVALAAERMRRDLARQVDELRQVAVAVEPLSRGGAGPHRLAALVRAYVANLYGDAPRPDLTVDVRSDLALHWTTEAVVLRIVQEAVHNVWRHARAARLRVTIGATGDRLTAEVLDDGVGIGGAQLGRGIDSMEVVAGFVDGELAITEAPGGGTRVLAAVDIGPPPSPTRRPQLRVVGDR